VNLKLSEDILIYLWLLENQMKKFNPSAFKK
jgi:hypothetical protein